ncbi:MAG TPA: hypothetical protein VNW71_16805 [Thermoanaerobaculia bacterium]|nr:hypothetical protein [Thermoanaerobaculia bacterium]
MTRMRLLPVLSTLVVMLTAGGVALAADTPSPAAELKAQPEAVPAGPELAELLFGQAPPLMSVDPKASKATTAGSPSQNTGWWYGICWTSCYYCLSDGDCPWGERCRFNVQCP